MEPAKDLSISIVVPVYKEEGNIDEFLQRIIPFLSEVTSRFEIIFALDPSPDKTQDRILAARPTVRAADGNFGRPPICPR
jgi:glycosyltransferase involved in cell wall biosynthesis